MKLKGISALIAGFALLVGLIVFEVFLFKGTTHAWIGCRASLLVAMAANLGFGGVAAFFGWAYQWLSDKSANDHVLLFGVKGGLYVFITLTIISLVLYWFKQPPTYAPGVVAVAPVMTLEYGFCCFEPLFWLWAFFEGSPTSQRKNHGKSGSAGHHPPPHP